MRAVQAVAAGGRAVMVTIHQPSVDVFESFGRLYLMQRGGRLTYFGDLGRESRDLVGYLTAVPGTPPPAPGVNPSTWMLEVTGAAKALRAPAALAAPAAAPAAAETAGGGGAKGGKGGEQQQQAPQQPVDWPARYAASPLAAANAAEAAALAAACREAAPDAAAAAAAAAEAAAAPPFSRQLGVLLAKFLAVYWRSVSYNRTRIMLAVVLALGYGSMYWGVGRLPAPATPATVQNVMGVMYRCGGHAFCSCFLCLLFCLLLCTWLCPPFSLRSLPLLPPHLLSPPPHTH